MAIGSVTIAQLARKYGAVVFFPTFAVSTIYADWSHTREWKRQQQLIAQRVQLQQQS